MESKEEKKYIRIHKHLNRSAIPFYRESAIDFFGEIMRRWNKSEVYQDLIFIKTDLKKILKFRNHEYLIEFLKQFSKDSTNVFELDDGRKIVGTAFTFTIDENIVEVSLNEKLKNYLFHKKDIELMKKNKQKLKMNPKEIETYNKNKIKYSNLMIFSQTELLNFNSKYSKRIYMLLIQFRNTGYFYMKYKKFKDILEIPKSYNQGHIDKQIFNKAIIDLKSAKIEIYKIEKIKKGRSIDRINIFFKYTGKQDFEDKNLDEEDEKLNINYNELTPEQKKWLERANKNISK